MRPCKTITSLGVLLTLILLTTSAQAQYGFRWSFQCPSTLNPLHYFCGAANMDDDPGDELVFFQSTEYRVIILDGATGNVEWDSGNWTHINIAGCTPNGTITYGFSPFCDINGDGKKEIAFDGAEVSIPWYVYVVGYTGSSSTGGGGYGIITPSPALAQNYPNPFNPTTTISYELTAPGLATVAIFNLEGQTVRTLINAEQTSGEHALTWNGRDDSGNLLSSGTYFYQLRVGDYLSTRKTILLK